jgi:hypothetical protein
VALYTREEEEDSSSRIASRSRVRDPSSISHNEGRGKVAREGNVNRVCEQIVAVIMMAEAVEVERLPSPGSSP